MRDVQVRAEIKRFLGFAGYYRKFVEGFSKLALSLTEMTDNGQTYVCYVLSEERYQELEKILTSTPVLSIPNPRGSLWYSLMYLNWD